jgi:integrase
MTGMRRGELMALRWGDVDLDTGLVSVERLTQAHQTRICTTPKNHDTEEPRHGRTTTPKNHGTEEPRHLRLSIGPRTVAVLRLWRKVQRTERLAWGEAYRGSEDSIFTWRTAGRCRRTS